MHSLPWLLVHGPQLWPIVLAALLLSALAIAFARPRIAAARAAARARRDLGPPDGALDKPSDGMRVTLAGEIALEDGAAKVARFEDGGDAAAASASYTLAGRGDASITGLNLRADRLALRVGAASVALEGPVEVVVGSREVQHGKALRDMPRAVQDRVASGFQLGSPHFRDQVTALRSIANGDVVRVSGVLRRDAGGEAAGYRGAADQWKLVPDGDEEQAAAGGAAPRGLRMAFEGTPRFEGPRAGWYARHAGAALVLGVVSLSLAGEIAAATIRDQVPHRAPDLGTSIAAATPWKRAAVLRHLAYEMDRDHDEDADSVLTRAALHTLMDDCTAAAQALARHGLLDRGAETAQRCGNHGLAARIFYEAGQFVSASHAWEHVAPNRAKPGVAPLADAEYRFGVRVHLLAGRADIAAREARAFAEALRDRGEGGNPSDPSRAALARCLADALDAKAGDAASKERLRGERSTPIYPACAILLADLYQGQERLDLIHGLTSFQTSAREAPMRWLELLEQEADPGAVPSAVPLEVAGDPSLFVINPTWAVHLMIPAVERAIAENAGKDAPRGDPRRAARVRAAVLAASFAAATGDYESARRFAQLTADEAEPTDEVDPFADRPAADPWTAQRAAALGAAVELSAGGVARAGELLAAAKRPHPGRSVLELDALVRYRADRDTSRLGNFYQGWRIIEEGVDRALAMAAEGDGTPLAAWLRKPSSESGAFLRLGAPLVKTGQEDLLRWIRLGYRMPGWFRSTSAEAVYFTDLAGAATALGDEAHAVMLRERAARFRAALLRRDLAVPLAVLERL